MPQPSKRQIASRRNFAKGCLTKASKAKNAKRNHGIYLLLYKIVRLLCISNLFFIHAKIFRLCTSLHTCHHHSYCPYYLLQSHAVHSIHASCYHSIHAISIDTIYHIHTIHDIYSIQLPMLFNYFKL